MDIDSKDSEWGMSRTAWNRAEAAQAGDLLRGFLSQVAGLGSLNSSERCAGTFHLWTSSDRHGWTSQYSPSAGSPPFAHN